MKKLAVMVLTAVVALSLPQSFVLASSFQDIEQVPWAKNHINYLSDREVVNGYDSSTFAPADNITRAQAALMIVRDLYPGEKASQTVNYPDVSESNFYKDAIALATEKGVIEGYEDGTFGPDDSLTRAEAAVMIDNAYNIDSDVKGIGFSDTTSLKWAVHSIRDLTAEHIIHGYPDGLFKPKQSINRAEFSVILGSTLNRQLINENTIEGQFKNYSLNDFEKKVVELTNDEREERGLNSLSIDKKLSKIAWYKSRDMQMNSYFEHESPTYGSPFDMMDGFNVNYNVAGENIAEGYYSPERVVAAWMDSPGHRENILRKGVTHIGVGFEGDFSTQMFIGK
ncbi:S-layer homology domain-containing protein [Halobacillus campisalis]|uniref:S-layer homology domain-containing protein n=1 Tax=Halobacillus campisalis TaxID=435909 RepID=A0ABW2K6H4_9BACI|nr:S-layer homology domain-containing protein [Halobacillus campisalis]